MKTRFGNVPATVVVIGGLLLFAALFQVAELLVGSPEPTVPEEPAESEATPAEPILVEVRKQGDDGCRIDIGGVRHSTLTIEGGREGRIDELVACIREGIDRAAQEGLLDRRLQGSGWFVREAERRRVSERIDLIQQGCLSPAVERDLRPVH